MKKTKKTVKVLDYKRIVAEIDKCLATDWAFEMIDCKRMPGAKPYTQNEAEEMADMLGKIYLIAHCIRCKACQTKYII